MILMARVRGNGAQLARYLMNSPANENAAVFDIRGTLHKDDIYLSLREMSVTSELTKSKQGLFHVVINPPQDAVMSAKDWRTCTDIIEKHMPSFVSQKRTMVLHQKGHVHMHVAYERYDHTTGKMIPVKFFKLALSKARRELEEVLEQKRTPFRNRDRDEIKQTLSKLWLQSSTGAEFIRLAQEHGYRIVRSESRRPFKVVDQKGIGHDLVRQLKGVRTNDVRQRLQGCRLDLDKTAIREIRTELDAGYFDRLQENSFAAILEQKKQYDERQEELLIHKEKVRSMLQAGQDMLQDSNTLTASQKKALMRLQKYRDKRTTSVQTKLPFADKPAVASDGKPNDKLEKALQELKQSMDEADKRQQLKQLTHTHSLRSEHDR